jgi:predicted DNA binding CopG/RHH family protein
MRDEYDFDKLNARKNPYAKELKKQVTIKISPSVIEYFKAQADKLGMNYQTIINLYLSDCVNNKRELQMTWK